MQPGVKYRGGAPPQPPAWHYTSGDVRAFERFEKKVNVWALQAKHYMSSAEAGLALYTSLRGDAEAELEFCDIEKVYSKDGVQYVLDQLRGPFQEKPVYIKRQFLFEYEQIARYANESLRSYTNRYRRCEASLRSVGIDVSLTYDQESRGSRLLDRAKLAPEAQRLVLVGTGQRLDYDSIKSALLMQYPEHRAPPPLFVHGQQQFRPAGKGHGHGKGGGKPFGQSQQGGQGFGQARKGSGKFTKRVLQTTTEGDDAPDPEDDAGGDDLGVIEEENPDIEPEETFEDQDDLPPDDQTAEPEGQEEVDNLTQVLTVTAKKLAAITLGRKWTGQPSKSVAERKRTSCCAVCGEMGHWSGDPECRGAPDGASFAKGGKGKNSSKGNGKSSKGSSSSFSGSKKVLTVSYGNGVDHETEYLPDDEPSNTQFVLMNHVIQPCLIAATEAKGFMVIDTACQRSCCGFDWYKEHAQLLRSSFHLHPYELTREEIFQFGSGAPVTANTLAMLPSAFEGAHCLVLGTFVLDAVIPFLGSLSMLNKLGAIIDLTRHEVFFSKLDCVVPLATVGRHLAVNITKFPSRPDRLRVWAKITSCGLHDPEVNLPPSSVQVAQASTSDESEPPLGLLYAPRRPEACGSMAPFGEPPPPDGSTSVDDTSHGFSPQPPRGQGRLRDRDQGQQVAFGSFLKGKGSAKDQEQASDKQCGRSQGVSPKADGKLQPPDLQTPRQPPRQLRNVPNVSGTMEVGGRRLETAWWLIQLLATAAIFLDHNGWEHQATSNVLGPDHGSVLHGSSTSSSSVVADALSAAGTTIRGPHADNGSWKPFHPDGRGQQGRMASSSTSSNDGGLAPSSSIFNDIISGRPWTQEGRRDAGRGPEYEGQAHVPMGARSRGTSGDCHPLGWEPLAPGRRKRLIGGINKEVHILEIEKGAINNLPGDVEKNFKIDLMELFAGIALPTRLARQYGLSALQPFDKNDGYDLSNRSAQQIVKFAQDTFKPLLLLVGFPRTLQCIMNENLNYSQRLEELWELRELQRPLLEWVVARLRQQLREGRLIALENPLRSRLWSEPSVTNMISDFGLMLVKCDAGYFGAVDPRGNKIIKTYQFATNSPYIAQALGHQLTAEERAQCTPLEGIAVTKSQEYPIKMVRALLQALRKEAKQWSPNRFDPAPVEVFFAQPSDDEPTWRAILNEVEQIFRRGAARSLVLQPGHDLYDKIAALVPWELSRIQVAAKPMTRRQPRDLPHTHRGSILLFNDEVVEIEVEDMLVNQFPKRRFEKPVRVAVFFFGFATEDQPKPQQERDREPAVHLPVPGLSTDVAFPNAPATLPMSVRASLARLHIGAGHPHKKEMICLLAAHGSINSSVMTALEHMKCGTCERNARPTQPHAAAVPQFTGQFAERVQADMFYTRDLSGGNHPVLGAVDMATNLQQAIRLVSINAQHVWDSFRAMWFAPFGYPLILEVDAGTPFQGVFKEHALAAGIHIIVVPPEAHWRIGAVERRNAVLRTIVDKLVDNHGVTNAEGVDFVLVAAVQAINSTVATKGRSPYQAAFGKLPRFPGDLFGDPHALTVGDRYLLAEQLRVQAMHAINEMRASQTIRRALLRKTPPSKHEAQQILPGALAAYWRWSKKASGRKRGGYALGRLVQHDASSNTAWLQTGGTLVQVTYEQLRPAFGLEGWVPSDEDIKCLKDARTRLIDGLWQDERGPGPPDDEPMAPVLAPQTPGGPPDLVPPLTDIDMPPPAPEAQALRLPLAGASAQPFGPRVPQTPPLPQVYSPTYKQTTTHNIQQHFYDHPRERTPRRQEVQPHTSTTVAQHTIQTQPQQAIASGSTTGLPLELPDMDMSMNPQASIHDMTDTTQQAHADSSLAQAAAEQAEQQTEQALEPQPATTLQVTHTRTNRDYWQNTRCHLIRHHVQPRRRLCTPGEVEPLPVPASQLTGERTTHPIVDGQPDQPITDNWLNSTAPQQDLGKWWIGTTQFTKGNAPTQATLIASMEDGEPVLFTPPPQDWDGRPITNEHMPVPTPSWVYRTKAAEADKDDDILESSSNDESTGKEPKMTRQQRKAMDREIPWRVIVQGDPKVLQLYIEANKKEYKSWMQWNGVVPVEPKEAKEILSHPQLKKRVIPSRNAYRDKNRGAGLTINDIIAKCRTVILGHFDPDLASMSRASPTPTKLAESILLQIACSGMNRLVENTTMLWHLWAGDVKTAFLQGVPEQRSERLWMRPPRDGIQAAAQTFPHDLYLIQGNLYGFSSAPKTWSTHVCKTLLGLRMVQHRYDRMMFLKRDQAGLLQVILIVHLDDFLVAHREDYDLEEIKAAFTWGSQTALNPDNEIVFRGKEIRMAKKGSVTTLQVTQKAFIKEIDDAPTIKKKEHTSLTPSEWQEFRSVTGSLQWLAGQTRPDAAAITSLSNKGRETTTKELSELYEFIKVVKLTESLGLSYYPVPWNRATTIVGYSDSSWANAPGHKSQMGVLVMVTSPECTQKKCPASVLDWKSTRSPRVTRSTLASEANAMDECADRCVFTNYFMTHLLWPEVANDQLKMSHLQATDCRSLYDAVISPAPSLTEKRTIVTVMSIQDYLKEEQVRWVPTDAMWADALTKVDVTLIERFQRWLAAPFVQLVAIENRKHSSANFSLTEAFGALRTGMFDGH